MAPPVRDSYFLGENPDRDLLLRLFRTALFFLRGWSSRNRTQTIMGLNILPLIIFLGHINTLISRAIDSGHQAAGRERVRRLTVQLTAEEERLAALSLNAPSPTTPNPDTANTNQMVPSSTTTPSWAAVASNAGSANPVPDTVADNPVPNGVSVAVVPPQPQTDLARGFRQVPPRFQNRRGAVRGRGGYRVRGHRYPRRP